MAEVVGAASGSSSSAAAKKRRKRAKKASQSHGGNVKSAESQPLERKSDVIPPCSTPVDSEASSHSKTHDTATGPGVPFMGGGVKGHQTVSPQGIRNMADLMSCVDSHSSFEDELEWCVAQLELGLLRKDISKPRRQENERNIKTLRSSKPPVPRKRQLMRNLFGDYRAKMKTQPLTRRRPEIVPVERETCEKVGRFYRQSVTSVTRVEAVQSPADSPTDLCPADVGVDDFRFDFGVS